MEEKKHYGNYDLLRIVCCIAVIVIHVSGKFKGALTNDESIMYGCDVDVFSTLIWNTLSRFAVPCFMMLSGAFLISDKNKEYHFFYANSFKKIGIPTVCFSLFYFLYSVLRCILAIFIEDKPWGSLISPIKNLIKGAPFYHMWYMYTLIGVYLFIPVVIRIKEDIGERRFSRLTWVYIVIATASEWTSSFKLDWGICKVIGYVAFVMVGYEIKRICHNRKNNFAGMGFVLGGLLFEGIVTFIQYSHTIRGIAESDETYSIVGNFNPLIVVASILIFAGFSLMEVNGIRYIKLAQSTFLVYLFHAGVWDVLSRLIVKTRILNDSRLLIPISIISVLVISVVLSAVYSKIWNFFEKRTNFTNIICEKLKL